MRGLDKPKRGISRDRALSQDNFIGAARWHSDGAGQGILADAERLEKFLEQDLAGVNIEQLLFHPYLLSGLPRPIS